MDKPIHNLIRSATDEFRAAFETSPWEVRVFRFDWSSVKTKCDEGDTPTPKMRQVSAGETVSHNEQVGRAAAASALLHCAVMGARNVETSKAAMVSHKKELDVSMCSFPILHPWAFQANPGVPLLLGVANYTGPIALTEAIEDYRLTILGEKYAELIASHFAESERSSIYSPEVFLANSIHIDECLFTFDLEGRLNALAHTRSAHNRITDSENMDWYEFSPGLRASIVALMEYRFFRERIGKSRAYMKQLDETHRISHSSH